MIPLRAGPVSFGVQSITVCDDFNGDIGRTGTVVTIAPLVCPCGEFAWNDCAAAGLGPSTSDVAIASVEHSETLLRVRAAERVIMTSTAIAGW